MTGRLPPPCTPNRFSFSNEKPGVDVLTLNRSSSPRSSSSAAPNAATDNGMSCSFSSTLRDVTTISCKVPALSCATATPEAATIAATMKRTGFIQPSDVFKQTTQLFRCTWCPRYRSPDVWSSCFSNNLLHFALALHQCRIAVVFVQRLIRFRRNFAAQSRGAQTSRWRVLSVLPAKEVLARNGSN